MVGWFANGKGGDISKAGVGASEHLTAGTFAGEGPTSSGGETRAEDLAKVGWPAEVDSRCLKEIVHGGVWGEAAGEMEVLL